jgi:hypothetical protein
VKRSPILEAKNLESRLRALFHVKHSRLLQQKPTMPHAERIQGELRLHSAKRGADRVSRGHTVPKEARIAQDQGCGYEIQAFQASRRR